MQQKRNEQQVGDPCAITDMIGNLFTELATMFYSISKVTRTVLTLKDQLGKVSPQQIEQQSNDDN